MASKRHPTSKVRGGGRGELPHIQGQWRLGGDTPHPRSVAAGRRHPASEVRGGSWEEPPMPEARACSWEEQPEERWLRRHRRA